MMALFLLASSHAYSTSHTLRDEPNVTKPGPSKGQSPSLGLSPDDLPSIPDKLWFTWWGAKTGGHSGSASFKVRLPQATFVANCDLYCAPAVHGRGPGRTTRVS